MFLPLSVEILRHRSPFFPSQGYHTLLAVFAVRCLPHHTFLQYIDHGVVQLTETFVSRLMTGTHTSTSTEKHSRCHREAEKINTETNNPGNLSR